MSIKYALVTGGSRGIGRAVCLKFSQLGIPVIIGYHSNTKAAEEVRDTILQNGGTAETLRFDVGDKAQVEAALGSWEQNHPQDYIAYLVNNAGIARDNLMFMMTDEDWDAVMNTSVNGMFYVTRYLLPQMMARGRGGRIVNMSSLSGLKGLPGPGNGHAECHRQRRGARFHHHGYDQRTPGRGTEEDDPHEALRQAGGSGRTGSLPVLRQRSLHYRGSNQHQWRTVLV